MYEELIINVVLFIFAVFLLTILFYLITKKPPKDIAGRHVVITGGSSGIGLHVALICAKLGSHVTIIARNIRLLEEARDIIKQNTVHESQKINCLSLDLSKDYQSVETAFKELEEEIGDIYMLVNCAGIAICGTVEDVSVNDAKLMMDINYFATYYPTRYVLPKMKSKRDGIIVITASQAALLGIYGYGPYSASKFALRGLAETIAMETKNKNIHVTLALPADTNTPGFAKEQLSKPEETKIISASGGLFDPHSVAKQILTDSLSGNFFSILGFESWILALLCVGMAPWTGPILITVQAFTMGILRLAGLIFQLNFQRIINSCQKEKKD